MNTETPTAERLHHPHSPSKLQMLESCPRFDSAFTGSEAATIGTLQHSVADTGEDNPHLADEKAIAAVECMRFVSERVARYPGCTVLKEVYLPIDDADTTAGYLDVGIVSADGRNAEVIDFKYGQVEVEPAPNNLQGIAYMLGIFRRYPLLEECTVFFLMPARDQISHHTFKRSEFAALHTRIRVVVARAVEAPADFSTATPNVSACLFCSNVGRCPKVAEVALKVGKKYAPLTIPESVSTSVFTDPAQIGLGLKLAAVIKVWSESYRSQATAKTIDDQNFIPDGYTLVPSQRRKVISAKGLAELAKTFLPDEMKSEVEKLYDVPIGALEKLISLAAPRGSKDSTVVAFGEKAVTDGHLELGQPFAFLKQSKKAE